MQKLESRKYIKRILPVSYLLIFIFLSVAFNYFSPATSPPDETAHLSYPRYVLQNNSTPHFKNAFDFWESHQPPLYYLLSLPIVSLTNSLPFEWQVMCDRGVSLLLGCIACLLMLKIGRKLFPDTFWVYAGFLMMLLLPMVLYAASSYSNDILMLIISLTLILFIQKKVRFERLPLASLLAFGVIVGLGLLTKIFIYPILVICWLYVLWGQPLKNWIISSLLTISVSFWWFVGNLRNVGDIVGLKNTFILWQGQKPALNFTTLTDFISKISSSFIGIFGKQNIAFPKLIYISIVAALIFLLIRSFAIKPLPSIVRLSWIFCISGFIFICVQNIFFFQPQGRYLLAIIPFFGICIGYGISSLSHNIQRFVSVGMLLVLIILNIWGIQKIYTWYQQNPIDFLTNNRHINLIALRWKGDSKNIVFKDNKIEIIRPVKIYSLADLRILTQRHPFVTIEEESLQPFVMTIRWKKLGENSFSFLNANTISVQKTQRIPLITDNPTLIQDLEIEFSNFNSPLIISQFNISTQ